MHYGFAISTVIGLSSCSSQNGQKGYPKHVKTSPNTFEWLLGLTTRITRDWYILKSRFFSSFAGGVLSLTTDTLEAQLCSYEIHLPHQQSPLRVAQLPSNVKEGDVLSGFEAVFEVERCIEDLVYHICDLLSKVVLIDSALCAAATGSLPL